MKETPIEHAYSFGEKLTDEEIKAICQDPWQVFKPLKIVVFHNEPALLGEMDMRFTPVR